VAFGLDDYAIGKGLDLSLSYGIGKVREVWKQKPIDRLLLLLHFEFIDQGGASLEQVRALKTHQKVREPFLALLDGHALDPKSVGAEIATQFDGHPNALALGEAMAEAAGRLAPFARDGSEAEAAISAQLKDGFAQIKDAMNRMSSEVAAQRSEQREQMAGLEEMIQDRFPPPEDEPPPTGGSAVVLPRRPGGGGSGSGARSDAEAQASAAQLMLMRVHGKEDPELAAAFELATAEHHEEAAAEFAAQAERFEAEELSELAEECRQNQAAALEAAGRAVEALEVRILLARRQIERGSDLGLIAARELLHKAPPGERWRFEALLAEADWPEQPGAAIEALADAARRAEGAESLHWTAAAVEVLVIYRDYGRALELARPLSDSALQPGDRMRLELDLLEAREGLEESAIAAEPRWQKLLEWAVEAPAAVRATVLARRGGCLLRREAFDEALVAYQAALESWAGVPGFEDQVAEVFWSMQAAGGLMSRYRPPHAELRGTAAALRGRAQSPAARADALESRALQARLDGKLYEALRGFWLAFALHRRVGNLRGIQYDSAMLGEVLLGAGRHTLALACFIQAAREERAQAAAEGAPPDEIAGALAVGGPRWERAASYAVLAAVGRRLPPESTAELAPTVLAEAEQPLGGLISPQPSNRAREAVAGLLLGMSSGHRMRALPILREMVASPHPVLAPRASQALVLATNAGIADETGFLVDHYLADAAVVGISSPWVGNRLDKDASARRRVEAAAADGNEQALEALAISNGVDATDTIAARVAERVERFLASVVAAEPTQSVGIGSYEGLGIFGRLAPTPLRAQLAEALIGIAADARYPEANRASAGNALFNVARTLDAGLRRRLFAQLVPLAAGEYELSHWEDSPLASEDPLARFKMSFGKPGDLQAAAIEAAAAMSDPPAHGRETLALRRFRTVLYQSRLDQRANVVAAAYSALARLPRLASEAAIEVGLAHADARVRGAALRAWMAKASRSPMAVLRARLLIDPDLNVRLTFLNMAAELGARGIVEAFCADPDAYVRAWAQTRLAATD